MKKRLLCLLALVLALGCLLALTACDEKTESTAKTDSEEENESVESKDESQAPVAYTPAEGYTLYEKGAVSFAYPADWSLADGTNPIMTGANGNNINLVTETATKENTEMYKSLSEQTFAEQIGNTLISAGITFSNVNVETRTNDGGVEVIYCSYDGTYVGVQMTFYQYIILGEKNHYTITATAVSDMSDIVEELFKSIRVK